jgi:hypothetical protein
MKNYIGPPLRKLELNTWSTTPISGDFKLQFKIFRVWTSQTCLHETGLVSWRSGAELPRRARRARWLCTVGAASRCPFHAVNFRITLGPTDAITRAMCATPALFSLPPKPSTCGEAIAGAQLSCAMHRVPSPTPSPCCMLSKPTKP